jgi:hypothetical protein
LVRTAFLQRTKDINVKIAIDPPVVPTITALSVAKVNIAQQLYHLKVATCILIAVCAALVASAIWLEILPRIAVTVGVATAVALAWLTAAVSGRSTPLLLQTMVSSVALALVGEVIVLAFTVAGTGALAGVLVTVIAATIYLYRRLDNLLLACNSYHDADQSECLQMVQYCNDSPQCEAYRKHVVELGRPFINAEVIAMRDFAKRVAQKQADANREAQVQAACREVYGQNSADALKG